MSENYPTLSPSALLVSLAFQEVMDAHPELTFLEAIQSLHDDPPVPQAQLATDLNRWLELTKPAFPRGDNLKMAIILSCAGATMAQVTEKKWQEVYFSDETVGPIADMSVRLAKDIMFSWSKFRETAIEMRRNALEKKVSC